MADAIKNSRIPVGSRNYRAKLAEADIIAIVSLLDSGMSQRRIAEKYGVSTGLIQLISEGKCWKHVNPRFICALNGGELCNAE